MLATAFLVTTIKRSLRVKGRTLLVFCKELDAANAKLTALYTMVKQMAVCTDFQELMDAATTAPPASWASRPAPSSCWTISTGCCALPPPTA
jgi:hypothetical protein